MIAAFCHQGAVVGLLVLLFLEHAVAQGGGHRGPGRPPWAGPPRPPGPPGAYGPHGPHGPPGVARRQMPSPARQDGEDADCSPSLTTMNGGQSTCSGQLIFEDNFNDLDQWAFDVHMAGPPDYEFVVYKNSPWNIFIERGILNIKATLTEDKYGVGFVSNGTMVVKRCTATDRELCERTAFSYNILPPLRSSRIHTAGSFSFRYGVVEMRVRGPRGDWLYPQLVLKPSQPRYGDTTYEVRMPTHFGNKFLRESGPGHKGWRGRKLMRAGVALGRPGDTKPHLVSVETRASQDVADWSRTFHIVRMQWSPDGFEYWVDGESMGKIPVPHGGFASLLQATTDHAWSKGEKNAPFDQEFFLTIGLGVGGSNRFPDNITNGQNAESPKPWKNTSPKAMLNFWKAKDFWYPTWQLPFVQVSYTKVWAL